MIFSSRPLFNWFNLTYVANSRQCENGETTFYCKNGDTTRCGYRCDGDDDCGDYSDEEPSVCPTNKQENANLKSHKVRMNNIVLMIIEQKMHVKNW